MRFGPKILYGNGGSLNEKQTHFGKSVHIRLGKSVDSCSIKIFIVSPCIFHVTYYKQDLVGYFGCLGSVLQFMGFPEHFIKMFAEPQGTFYSSE